MNRMAVSNYLLLYKAYLKLITKSKLRMWLMGIGLNKGT